MNHGTSSAKLRQISLVLFSASIVLWSVSIEFAQLAIGTYGLIGGLPPPFLVALTLLTVSFLVSVRFNPTNRPFLFLHVIALLVFIYLLAAPVERTARFAPSYLVCGPTDCTLEHYHLNSSFASIGGQFRNVRA